jgi:MinD-like ATPase involved in chromosome partitioning or flagellar assembly
VTGASRGSASTLVAANLAAALARTGSDVVLLGAHLPDSVVDAAPLARMLGVAAVPGLSDLLAGRVGLARALQRTPRIPSLRVITTGGAATAAGLMQSQRLKDTLESLRRQGGYVVIEAPSTTSSADAQSLASLADAAILAVELRRARRPALLDAAEQLQRVGTPLLGAVVLPRLTGARGAEERDTQEVTVADDMTTVLDKLPPKEPEEPMGAKRIRTAAAATATTTAPKAVQAPPSVPKRQTRTISVTRVNADAAGENGADKRR